MHAHEMDGIDVDVGRRAAEAAREPGNAMPGLAERRPDVLEAPPYCGCNGKRATAR